MSILTIKVKVPSNASKDDLVELADYCLDALQTWGGQRHPDDWLFGGVEVKSIRTSSTVFRIEK